MNSKAKLSEILIKKSKMFLYSYYSTKGHMLHFFANEKEQNALKNQGILLLFYSKSV